MTRFVGMEARVGLTTFDTFIEKRTEKDIKSLFTFHLSTIKVLLFNQCVDIQNVFVVLVRKVRIVVIRKWA